MAATRVFIAWWLLRSFAKSPRERLLLVGPTISVISFASHLDEHGQLGLAPVCIACTDHLGESGPLPVVDISDLPGVCHEYAIDRVVICSDLAERHLVQQVVRDLLPTAVPVQFAPDLDALPVFCMHPIELAGRPVVNLTGNPMTPRSLALKWCEDKVLAIAFLGIAGVPMLLIAFLIRLTSPGPALFVQERHGLGGRPIRVFKFRTMRQGLPTNRSESSATRPAVVPSARSLVDGSYLPDDFKQASASDPRITPLGHLLRKTSLDELPQLLNVLRGDMSIVGPRPHAIRHNQQFTGDIVELMRRHFVKPGITGLAQISGARGETRTVLDMRKRIQYDLEYIRTWTLWLDLRIIGMTLIKGFINRQP